MKWKFKQSRKYYALVEIKDDKKIFIHWKNFNWAIDWDEVEVDILEWEKLDTEWKKTRNAEWKIKRVLKRSDTPKIAQIMKVTNKWIIARIYLTNKWQPDIFIEKQDFIKKFRNIRRLGWVRLKIVSNSKNIKWNPKNLPYWEILEYYSNISDHLVAIQHLLDEKWINQNFTKAQINYAEKRAKEIKLDNRKEIKDITVTIDWSDAKDLDDAISVNILENWNYKLWVHIADVSNYIEEDSVLDKEALARWSSLYFPWSVIPMLPEVLSNKVCSLNPEWYKATFSIVLEIDNSWEIINKDIFQSKIKTNARLTYDEVFLWKTKKEYSNNIKKNSKVEEVLNNAINLDIILQKFYKKVWMIDFHSNELNIELDTKLNPIKITKRHSHFVHKLIETFMVTANTQISKSLQENNLPCIYRTHEEPNSESLSLVNTALIPYWIDLIPDNPTPIDISRVIKDISWLKNESLISDILIRSMSKAIYTYDKPGHFWLALWAYSHFTSPIRRYADLVLHRLIKKFYLNKWNKNLKLKSKLKNITEYITKQELIFVQTERAIIKIFCIKYMQKRMRKEFNAIISWFNDRWVFIQLKNWIEWFIWNAYLKDFSKIDNIKLDNGNITLLLWDSIKAKCINSNVEKMFLDFELI